MMGGMVLLLILWYGLQEHRLEGGCGGEAGKLECRGWRCGFSPAKRNALKARTDSSLATSAGTFVAAPKQWAGVSLASARLAERRASGPREAHHGMGAYHGALTVYSVYFYHTEEWTERNQQLLEATSREIRRCPGIWILASDFNLEPETFGQYATPARLPGVLVKPAAPTFRHGASVGCFDYFAGSR